MMCKRSSNFPVTQLCELSLNCHYTLSLYHINNLRSVDTVEDLPFHFIYRHSLQNNNTQVQYNQHCLYNLIMCDDAFKSMCYTLLICVMSCKNTYCIKKWMSLLLLTSSPYLKILAHLSQDNQLSIELRFTRNPPNTCNKERERQME